MRTGPFHVEFYATAEVRCHRFRSEVELFTVAGLYPMKTDQLLILKL
jgi:hypothetical protein